MILTTTVDKAGHIERWIQIFNGGLKLTDKEREFLGHLLDRALTLMADGVKEPYLGEILFNQTNTAEIKELMGNISKQALNNYKISLVKKGVVYKDESGMYHIKDVMIPKESVTFNFKTL